MLVLSRKTSQTIVINQEITIRILQVQGAVIRVGIEAPRHVPVRRGELGDHSSLPDRPAHRLAPST